MCIVTVAWYGLYVELFIDDKTGVYVNRNIDYLISHIRYEHSYDSLVWYHGSKNT